MKALKRFRGLIIFTLVMGLLFGGLVVGKNVFVRQARAKIDAAVTYSGLRLSYFPPAIVLDDVRTKAAAPFFSARSVTVRISYASLLRREKPLTVFIDRPVLRIPESSPAVQGEARPFWPLPFAIDRGLIREGEVEVRDKTGVLIARNIKALFIQSGDEFTLQAESGEALFTPASSTRPFGGAVSIAVSGRSRVVTIKRLVVEGPGFVFKGQGKLVNSTPKLLTLRTVFDVETGYLADYLKIPFDWKGKAEGNGLLETKDGELYYGADFESRGFVMNGVPVGEFTGRVGIRGRAGGQVDLDFRKQGASAGSLTVRFGGGKIEGQVRGTRLDPVLSYAGVPWPVRSPVWGSFTIAGNLLGADGEFRDNFEGFEHPRYPFQGKFRFDMDIATKELSFSSPEIDSSFGKVEVQGKVRVGRDADVTIRGEVKDAAQAREITSFAIHKKFDFLPIRGRGTADVRIVGDFSFPDVSISFFAMPGGFGRFDAASVEGNLQIGKEEVLGRFRVDDRDMKGEIGLVVKGARTEADFRVVEGSLERILPPLDITFPVTGRGAGTFKLVQEGPKLEFGGDFTSPGLLLLGQPATDVRGAMEWKDGALRFSGLRLSLLGGPVTGGLMISFPGMAYDIDLSGRDLQLSKALPGIGGLLTIDLKGRGVFGADRPRGKFEIKNLAYAPNLKTAASGDWALNFIEDRIDLDINGGFLPGPNDFRATVRLPLHKDDISADIKGAFDDLSQLLPWKGAKGRLNYLAEVRGPRTAPKINGAVDLQGSILPLPQFAHALTDFTGLAFIQDGQIAIRSFQGKLGDGDVRGGGTIGIGPNGIETIDVRMDGRNMLLSPFERTRALTDGWLRLLKDSRSFVLSGEMAISRLLWRREATEKLGFSSTPYPAGRPEKGFFDDLTLDLRLRAAENARLENSLGKINGRFDLTISGNIRAPVVLGEIDALDGEVNFQDRKFKVIRGRLSFLNPASVEPYLDFRGETYVKDYRVTFTLTGLISNLKPEFTSSPPLPSEDVLALLALGEAFRRTYSYDTSTQLSTASLLSFQLADQAQKRAQGLFSLARFRIDPFVMGSSAEMSARLTVGRQISRNLSFLYSTNLTTQREEIYRIEWEFGRDFSLVGMRNEWGRISFDVKIRKRF
jgi:hypothetical protein